MRTPQYRRHRGRFPRSAVALAAVLGLAVAAGCAPSSGPSDGNSGKDGDSAGGIPATKVDSNFDLDKLVTAAKKEGSVTVYDSTGDILEAAKAFTAKYGIKATGVKSKSGNTLQKMTRENQSGNVTIDLTLYEDGPTFVGEMLPQHTVYTWLPGDLVDKIAEKDRTPPQVLSKANVFAYNPKLYPNGCPVNNIWDLTDPKWRGRIAMQDPLGKPTLVSFFSQLSSIGGDKLKKAYQDKYGKPLKTDEKSPAREWIKQLAGNSPILTSSDGDASAAVGAPNQTKKRMGLFSTAKFRDIKDKGYHLRVCQDMEPWAGFQYPKYVGIAKKAKHPNAAKLFVHFMYTKEGITTEMHNGGLSANSEVPPGPNPPGLTDWEKQLFIYDSSKLLVDYHNIQSIQDLWRLSHK